MKKRIRKNNRDLKFYKLLPTVRVSSKLLDSPLVSYYGKLYNPYEILTRLENGQLFEWCQLLTKKKITNILHRYFYLVDKTYSKEQMSRDLNFLFLDFLDREFLKIKRRMEKQDESLFHSYNTPFDRLKYLLFATAGEVYSNKKVKDRMTRQKVMYSYFRDKCFNVFNNKFSTCFSENLNTKDRLFPLPKRKYLAISRDFESRH
jgi:hypothetical protein